MPAFKLLLFDLDDTLWPTRPVLENAERETYRWLQQNASQVSERYSLKDLFARRIQLLRDNPLPEHKVSEMRKLAYRLLAEECGYGRDEAQKIAESAFDHFLGLRQRVQLYEDVEHNLALLKQRFMLGALSNGNADLSRIPVGKHFDFALSTENLRHGKPHPAAFEAALEAAVKNTGKHVDPAEAVHIGDDLKRDVAGARAAGLHAIWLDRNETEAVNETTAVARTDAAGAGAGDSGAVEVCDKPGADGYHAKIRTLDDLHAALEVVGNRTAKARPGG